MINLIVLADTHGHKRLLSDVQPAVMEADAVIFLGDCVPDISDILRSRNNVFCVAGNCDPFSSMPKLTVYEAEGKRILLTHGDEFDVKSGLDRLAYAAKELNCECALYGHTHIADRKTVGGVLLLNPGSFRPRGGEPSYIYMTLIQNRPILHRIVRL